jgi:hypothetical protein
MQGTTRELDEALCVADPGHISEDDSAALWLYVWSRRGRRGRVESGLSADASRLASPAMIRYLAALIGGRVRSPRERLDRSRSQPRSAPHSDE